MKTAFSENLKKEALLSEKETTKDVIATATKASDTTTSTSNKTLS